MSSECINNRLEYEYLDSVIGNNKNIIEILYKGSIDGWLFKDFHSKVDNNGSTITLMKLSNGQCIGGYTKYDWSNTD